MSNQSTHGESDQSLSMTLSQAKLKVIKHQNIWGNRTFSSWYTPNLITFNDNEFIMASGSNLFLFENGSVHSRKSRIISTYSEDILYVRLMTLSSCRKYFAVDIRKKNHLNNEINFLIYHTSNHFLDYPKPREISYKINENSLKFLPQDYEKINGISFPTQNKPSVQVLSLVFSASSNHLACSTNQSQFGILIFQQIKGVLLQSIDTGDSIPLSISFHPNDDFKIFACGSNGLAKFWRFNAKTVHVAPIVGLRKSAILTHTVHTWLDSSKDSVIIVGSEQGMLSIYQNCEQKVPSIQVFKGRNNLSSLDSSPSLAGSPSITSLSDCSISQILHKGDNLLVISPTNRVILLQIRRIQLNKGMSNLTTIVQPLAAYSINGIDRILGIQFCIPESLTSYALMLVTNNFISTIDMITDRALSGEEFNGSKNDDNNNFDTFDLFLLGENDNEFSLENFKLNDDKKNQNENENEKNEENNGSNENEAENNENEEDEDKILDINPDEIVWQEVNHDKPLLFFHSKSIQSLSVSTKGNLFFTSSYDDSTMRVWDLNSVSLFDTCWLSEDFSDNIDEKPFHAVLHPSGMQIASGTESEIREYAIGDEQLQLIRRFGVRIPFAGHEVKGANGEVVSTGVPVIISQPISKIRYSNGGHLLAVVTGKVAQIFHMYNTDSDSVNPEITLPNRVMVLSEHAAGITDIVFSPDDRHVYTTASDGTVYSWKVGASGRDAEFVLKGIPANCICASNLKGINYSKGDRNKGKNSCVIVASFERPEQSVGGVIPSTDLSTFAKDVVRNRRASHLGNRNSNNLSMISENESSLHSLNMKRPKSPIAVRVSSTASSDPVTSIPYLTHNNQENFLIAVWENGVIGPTPHLMRVSAPVKSISMGDTSGPDRMSLCVLGLADGRILISLLPIPMIELFPSVPVSISTSHSSTIPLSSTNDGKSSLTSSSVSISSTSLDVVTRLNSRKYSIQSVQSNNSSRSRKSLNSSISSARKSSAFPSKSNLNVSTINEETDEIKSSVDEQEDQSDNNTSSIITSTAGAANINDLSNESTKTPSANTSYLTRFAINESQCRLIRLLVGAVQHVSFSSCGNYLILAGQDGTVHTLTTFRETQFTSQESARSLYSLKSNKTESTTTSTNSQNNQDTLYVPPMQFLMIEKSVMASLKQKLFDLNFQLKQNKRDFNMILNKFIEKNEKKFNEINNNNKKEISYLKTQLANSRNDVSNLTNLMQSQVEATKTNLLKNFNKEIMEYEKKLSQEILYHNNLKEAYYNLTLNNKLDLEEERKKHNEIISQYEKKISMLESNIENDKQVVLNYVNYIQEKNNEVLEGLEENQVEERISLKNNISNLNKQLQEMQHEKISIQVQNDRYINKLKVTIDQKDLELLQCQRDLEWANDRIQKLESSLHQATGSLKILQETNDKIVSKSIDSNKKLDDLEKLRKALTQQINNLQSEKEPILKDLASLNDKFNEITREYDDTIKVIKEKDHEIKKKTNYLTILNKQNINLTESLNSKNSIIKKVANSLYDFIHCLQETKNHSGTIMRQSQVLNNNNLTHSINANNNTLSTVPNTANSTTSSPGQPTTANLHTISSSSRIKLTDANGKRLTGLAAVVAALSLQPQVEGKLRKLVELLKPHLEEENNINGTKGSNKENEEQNLYEIDPQAFEEQQRQFKLLQRNISGLESRLQSSETAANAKTMAHLQDNKTLLAELNFLRTEIKQLSKENQRLLAKQEFKNNRKSNSIHTPNDFNITQQSSSSEKDFSFFQSPPTTTPSTVPIPHPTSFSTKSFSNPPQLQGALQKQPEVVNTNLATDSLAMRNSQILDALNQINKTPSFYEPSNTIFNDNSIEEPSITSTAPTPTPSTHATNSHMTSSLTSLPKLNPTHAPYHSNKSSSSNKKNTTNNPSKSSISNSSQSLNSKDLTNFLNTLSNTKISKDSASLLTSSSTSSLHSNNQGSNENKSFSNSASSKIAAIIDLNIKEIQSKKTF